MLIQAAYSALANSEIGRPYINYGHAQSGVDFMFNYVIMGDLDGIWIKSLNL